MPEVRVIIPAHNEEGSIGLVVEEIPQDLVSEVIVVCNACTDKTAENAKKSGATVLHESRMGYGYSCLKGMQYVEESEAPTDIIVFLDGDHSDYPEEMNLLLNPIVDDAYDLVIGSRALGKRESGSMTIPQIFGNWLATTLIRVIYNQRFTDLGPFRAVRWDKLKEMQMRDKTFGWTVEMQLKAAKMGMKSTEVAVNYRKRIGFSKVSGTVKGTILAGYKIIWTIFKYW